MYSIFQKTRPHIAALFPIIHLAEIAPQKSGGQIQASAYLKLQSTTVRYLLQLSTCLIC